MNSTISSIWRRTFNIFMVAVLSLLIYCISGQLPAQAKALTPEADYYQLEPEYAGKEMLDNAKQRTKDITDNILEKLNLDEPQPANKKQFSNQAEDQIENLTGTQEGYYGRKSQPIRD